MDRWKSCEKCQAWDEGLCKRYPPVPVAVPAEGGGLKFAARWPETDKADWCAEWLPIKLSARNGE